MKKAEGNAQQFEQAAPTFSEADYSHNAAKVVAHAAATGSAVVSSADGRPRVVISIPTSELPTLD